VIWRTTTVELGGLSKAARFNRRDCFSRLNAFQQLDCFKQSSWNTLIKSVVFAPSRALRRRGN
jgi:hypothetical protein